MSHESLTIVVLTKDEKPSLPRCLSAIPRCYPIVVVDSGSTDGTVSIALEHGCTVYSNAWSGIVAQRNFSLTSCDIKTPWVLFIDADEVYSKGFFDWYESEIVNREDIDVVMVPWVLYLRERRLKYAPAYPTYHPRLVYKDRVRFVGHYTGHGESIPADCRLVFASIAYDHHFCAKGLIQWMHKQMDRAVWHVRLEPVEGAAISGKARLRMLFGRSFFRIPARFIYHFIVRGGFRDGKAGLEYALMFSWFEATIYLMALAGIERPDFNG